MRVEWPTLLLILGCYVVWALGLYWLPGIWMPLAIAALVVSIALQSSLQHEVLHGHPFPGRKWGAVLVYASLNLAIPYGRFRDTHLSHHLDSTLTDPYDDPESNYLDPAVWGRLAGPVKWLLRLNNTLLGRMLLGPAIGQVTFMAGDWRQVRAGNRRVLRSWAGHAVMMGAILWLVSLSAVPLWAYLASAYAGLSLLKIRTFLEHQAHEKVRGRTVIIEDRGPLAFLFLNNNLHVVHHMHPRTPWYRLPQLYFSNREKYLTRNEGYRYDSYAQIFRRHLLRAKDPVPHPLWPRQ
ncbi:fatty acid desaturase [Nioella sp.]|uniref:fatty acid desaturase n=1 Tax=Nioella sp. TaxID=1912091 RepID=UPI0035166832